MNWRKFLVFLLLLSPVIVRSQVADNIVVKGIIFDSADTTNAIIPIVVNKRTGIGMSTVPGAVFSLSGIRTDTFQISSGGYEMVKICFIDSAQKASYFVNVGLKMKENYYASVTIYPVKDLKDIQRERGNLGVEHTYTTTGAVEAFASPITYLYDHYSKEGRSREMVAMLENEDRKREILKELFRTYNVFGVIDLKEDEFDTFITYLNLPESMLKGSSDFALATYIREKYIVYKNAEDYHIQNQR